MMSDDEIVSYLKEAAYDAGRDNMGVRDAVLDEAAARLKRYSQSRREKND